MKFCFILTQDLQSPSGLGRYYPWAKELNKLGYEIEIIALHSSYLELEKRREFFSNNFYVHYVSQMHVKKEQNNKRYFSNFHLFWIVFSATLLLTFFSIRSKADVYIIGKPHPMNGIAGLICKLINKGLIIVDCDDDETNSGNFNHGWQKKIVQYFEETIPKAADLITTNTKYTLNRLINIGITPQNIYYLSNGVDLERFTEINPKIKEKIQNDLNIKPEDLIIGYIGSMSLANHAIELLIDAFELVIAKKKNTKLLLVGGGEDFEHLQKYVANKYLDKYVIFTGRVQPENVKYYYSISEITVDPIIYDIAAKARSPLKIFESWACGTPILTSPIGDRGEIVNNGVNGFLTQESSHNYRDILQNIGTYKQLMKLNCKNSAKNFSWEELIRDFSYQLESIIELL